MKGLVARFQDFTGIGRPGRRKWIFVTISVVLFVLGQILRNVETLKGIEAFAWGVAGDLGNINVLNLIAAYGEEIWCTTTERFGEQLTSCGADNLINPINYIVSAPLAAWAVLTAPASDVAFVVYLVATITGAALANYLWRRYALASGRETNILDLAAIAIGAVLMTSVAALALQVLGIVLFAVFGGIIGLSILLLTDYKWVKELFDAARKVHRHVARGRIDPVDLARDAAGMVLKDANPLGAAEGIEETAETLEKAADWAGRRLKGDAGGPPDPKG